MAADENPREERGKTAARRGGGGGAGEKRKPTHKLHIHVSMSRILGEARNHLDDAVSVGALGVAKEMNGARQLLN